MQEIRSQAAGQEWDCPTPVKVSTLVSWSSWGPHCWGSPLNSGRNLAQPCRRCVAGESVTVFYNDRKWFCLKWRPKTVSLITHMNLWSSEVTGEIWKQSLASDSFHESMLLTFCILIFRKISACYVAFHGIILNNSEIKDPAMWIYYILGWFI